MCGLPSGKDSACQCSRCKRLRFNPWVRKIPLKEEVATHSSILAWTIPRTEEPGGLQSMGLQAVEHDWARTHSVAYQQRLCANPNLSVHPICSLPPWYPKGFKCRLHFNPCIPVAAWSQQPTSAHTAPPPHRVPSVCRRRHLCSAASPFLCAAGSCILQPACIALWRNTLRKQDRGKFLWHGWGGWVAAEGLFGCFNAISCDTCSS